MPQEVEKRTTKVDRRAPRLLLEVPPEEEVVVAKRQIADIGEEPGGNEHHRGERSEPLASANRLESGDKSGQHQGQGHRARRGGQCTDAPSPDPAPAEHQEEAARSECQPHTLAIEQSPADPHAGEHSEEDGGDPAHLLISEETTEPPDDERRHRAPDQ